VAPIMATRRWTATLWAALATAACLASGSSQAQDFGPVELPTPLSGQLIQDPAVEPASHDAGCSTCGGCGACSDCAYGIGGGAVMARQPINWISGPYLKGGLAMAVGEDLIESQDAGFTVNFGYRQPLMPALDERLFLDFGGSYLSAYGESTRIVPGLRTLNGVQLNVPNAFRATLDEIQRGGVHMSLGWYWGDIFDVRADDPQLRLATRFGGRWSHVRGQFDNERLVALPVGATLETRYQETDTAGGLFVGTELILLNRDTAAGTATWLIDGEFANDWIEFTGWDRGSLGTASITLGFMLSR
jgi:hypothetical protein